MNHRSSHLSPITGKCCPRGDRGGQAVSQPREGPEQEADGLQTAWRHVSIPISQLWPGVPAHVAAEGRESAGSLRAHGITGELPTHTWTWPPPWHHHPVQGSLVLSLGPPWQHSSASPFKVLFPMFLPQDNGCGPKKLATSSWEAAVAAKIKYRFLLRSFFHL